MDLMKGFPNYFSNKDAEQLEKVRQQNTALQQAYTARFADWENTSWAKRAFSSITPFYPTRTTFMGKAVTSIAEWVGKPLATTTPLEAQNYMQFKAKEQAELERRQRVAGYMEQTTRDIILASLGGQPVNSLDSFYKRFPEAETMDFTEAEKKWLVDFLASVAASSPEQLATGTPSKEDFSLEDVAVNLYGGIEDIYNFIAQQKRAADTAFIRSSVAFTHSTTDVVEALDKIFNPDGEGEAPAPVDYTEDQILAFEAQLKLIRAGKATAPTPEIIRMEIAVAKYRNVNLSDVVTSIHNDINKEITAKQSFAALHPELSPFEVDVYFSGIPEGEMPPEGINLPLVDTQTGEEVMTILKPDDTVWIRSGKDDYRIGYIDEQGTFTPDPYNAKDLAISSKALESLGFPVSWMLRSNLLATPEYGQLKAWYDKPQTVDATLGYQEWLSTYIKSHNTFGKDIIKPMSGQGVLGGQLGIDYKALNEAHTAYQNYVRSKVTEAYEQHETMNMGMDAAVTGVAAGMIDAVRQASENSKQVAKANMSVLDAVFGLDTTVDNTYLSARSDAEIFRQFSQSDVYQAAMETGGQPLVTELYDIARFYNVNRNQGGMDLIVMNRLASTASRYPEFNDYLHGVLMSLQGLPTTLRQESPAKDLFDTLDIGVRKFLMDLGPKSIPVIARHVFDTSGSDITIQMPMLMIGDTGIRHIAKTPENMAVIEEFFAWADGVANRAQARHDKFMAAHPEKVKPEKYSVSPVEALANVKSPDSVARDPMYWAHMVAENMPYALGILAISATVTALTKNPRLGMLAAQPIASLPIATQLNQDLIDLGVDPFVAADWSVAAGSAMGAVEAISDLPILSIFAKPKPNVSMGKLFVELLKKEGFADLLKRLGKKALTIEAIEPIEELVQNAIEVATINYFGGMRDWFSEAPDIIITTLVATLPMALFGGASDVAMRQAQRAKAQEAATEAYAYMEANNLLLPESIGEGGEIGVIINADTGEQIANMRELGPNGTRLDITGALAKARKTGATALRVIHTHPLTPYPDNQALSPDDVSALSEDDIIEVTAVLPSGIGISLRKTSVTPALSSQSIRTRYHVIFNKMMQDESMNPETEEFWEALSLELANSLQLELTHPVSPFRVSGPADLISIRRASLEAAVIQKNIAAMQRQMEARLTRTLNAVSPQEQAVILTAYRYMLELMSQKTFTPDSAKAELTPEHLAAINNYLARNPKSTVSSFVLRQEEGTPRAAFADFNNDLKKIVFKLRGELSGITIRHHSFISTIDDDYSSSISIHLDGVTPADRTALLSGFLRELDYLEYGSSSTEQLRKAMVTSMQGSLRALKYGEIGTVYTALKAAQKHTANIDKALDLEDVSGLSAVDADDITSLNDLATKVLTHLDAVTKDVTALNSSTLHYVTAPTTFTDTEKSDFGYFTRKILKSVNTIRGYVSSITAQLNLDDRTETADNQRLLAEEISRLQDTISNCRYFMNQIVDDAREVMESYDRLKDYPSSIDTNKVIGKHAWEVDSQTFVQAIAEYEMERFKETLENSKPRTNDQLELERWQIKANAEIDLQRAAIQRQLASTWTKLVYQAIYTGDISVNKARELGITQADLGNLVPLQENTYHVTMNKSGVYIHGLCTGNELEKIVAENAPHDKTMPTGLGGSAGDAISLTVDKDVALNIYNCLQMHTKILRGEITVDDLLLMAKRGEHSPAKGKPWHRIISPRVDNTGTMAEVFKKRADEHADSMKRWDDELAECKQKLKQARIAGDEAEIYTQKTNVENLEASKRTELYHYRHSMFALWLRYREYNAAEELLGISYLPKGTDIPAEFRDPLIISSQNLEMLANIPMENIALLQCHGRIGAKMKVEGDEQNLERTVVTGLVFDEITDITPGREASTPIPMFEGDIDTIASRVASVMKVIPRRQLGLNVSSRPDPIEALAAKWANRKKNISLLKKDLAGIDEDMYDISSVEEAIDEYESIERSDYDSAEDYQEARNEAWDSILSALEEVEAVELDEEMEDAETLRPLPSGPAAAASPMGQFMQKILAEAKTLGALAEESPVAEETSLAEEPAIAESVPATVDMWYDRKARTWVVQTKDADGNQIGDAVYVHSKAEAKAESDRIKGEISVAKERAPSVETQATEGKEPSRVDIQKWGKGKDARWIVSVKDNVGNDLVEPKLAKSAKAAEAMGAAMKAEYDSPQQPVTQEGTTVTEQEVVSSLSKPRELEEELKLTGHTEAEIADMTGEEAWAALLTDAVSEVEVEDGTPANTYHEGILTWKVDVVIGVRTANYHGYVITEMLYPNDESRRFSASDSEGHIFGHSANLEETLAAVDKKSDKVLASSLVEDEPTISAEGQTITAEALETIKKAMGDVAEAIEGGVILPAFDYEKIRRTFEQYREHRKRAEKSHGGWFRPIVDPDSLPDITTANREQGIKVGELLDTRIVCSELEEKTGIPFHAWHELVRQEYEVVQYYKEQLIKEFENNPRFFHIRHNTQALLRVEDYINAKNPAALNYGQPVAGITEDEIALANWISGKYAEFEPMVRFLRFIRVHDAVKGDVDKIADELHASVVDVESCIYVWKNMGEAALMNYMRNFTWGVINSGYDPKMISRPRMHKPPQSGGFPQAGRLLKREGWSAPELDKTVVQRLFSYAEGMQLMYRTDSLEKIMQEWLNKYAHKFQNPNQLGDYFGSFMRELKGIPDIHSWMLRVLIRIQNQAMPVIFWHPYLAFRNTFQPLAFFPYRDALVKYAFKRLTFSEQNYFDWFVSQKFAIRRDWLHTQEKPLWGMKNVTRLLQKTSFYGLSDEIPRSRSFAAGLGKAQDALKKFEKHKDINRLIRESGAESLEHQQQEYAKYLLTQRKVDFGIPLLQNVNGKQAFALYVAKEITNGTNFMYDRAERAHVERGAFGRVVANLFTFVKSYWQQMYLQGRRLAPHSGYTFNEKKHAVHHIMGMIIFGYIASQIVARVTGRDKQAYSPIEMMNWTAGGIPIGLMQDLSKATINIMVASGSVVSSALGVGELDKEKMASLPTDLSRIGESFLPFYKMLFDILEVTGIPKNKKGDYLIDPDSANLDKHLIRQARAFFDENYTPAQLEEMDRTVIEKVQHILFSGEGPDDTQMEIILKTAEDSYAKLGKRDENGNVYTMSDLSRSLSTVLKDIPRDMITTDLGYPPIAEFWAVSTTLIDEYYAQSSTDRLQYRLDNPDVDALLFMWGRTSVLRSEDAADELVNMCSHYKIPITALPRVDTD